jgi:DNA-binding response OmpR family regulator
METRAPTRTQPALGRLALKRVVVAAPSPPPAVSVRRALVVEGDRAVRDAICATLPRERFEVHAFADGDAAYEHGMLHGVDVAIIGKALPGIPGTVLCAMLRKSKAGAALSLVLTSPHYTHAGAGAGDCAAFGADQFIALPAAPDALLERVDFALAQREPLERLKVLPSDLARLVDALFERLDASTYYQLLDVPFEAERAAIQQAFHQRSLALHPDRHARLRAVAPHAFEKINSVYKRISEAYKVLSNVSQRHEYNLGLRRNGTLRYDTEARRRREEKNMEIAVTNEGRGRVLKAFECRTYGDLDGAQQWLRQALTLEPQNTRIADQIDAIGKLLSIVQQANAS